MNVYPEKLPGVEEAKETASPLTTINDPVNGGSKEKPVSDTQGSNNFNVLSKSIEEETHSGGTKGLLPQKLEQLMNQILFLFFQLVAEKPNSFFPVHAYVW